MINEKTALSVNALAVAYAERNLALAPVTGTPLDQLVQLTNTSSTLVESVVAEQSPETFLTDRARQLEYATAGSEGLTSPHDAAMDAFVGEISEKVRAHISFAKNVVAPVVLELAVGIEKAMGEAVDPSAEFMVEVAELPAPMRGPSFEETIAKVKGNPLFYPERELNLGAKTIEEMLQLMLTGSKEYDAAIAEWVASKQPGFFLVIWNNLFRDFKESQPTIVANAETLLTLGADRADTALAIYLLARKLFDEVPEATGMSLDAYRDTVAQYRDCAAVVLSQEYDRFNNGIVTGSLVVSVTSNRKTIRVNGLVYRDWLSKGGSIEVLYGMLVSNDVIYHTQAINEKKVQLLSAWNQFVQYSGTAAKNNAFNRFRDVCTLLFGEQMNNLSEEEQAKVAAGASFMENIEAGFKETLNGLVSADLMDHHEVALKLVCRGRFFYTDAEKILRGINEATKANPGIDVRQAALLSTIEYVSDWLADQIKIDG